MQRYRYTYYFINTPDESSHNYKSSLLIFCGCHILIDWYLVIPYYIPHWWLHHWYNTLSSSSILTTCTAEIKHYYIIGVDLLFYSTKALVKILEQIDANVPSSKTLINYVLNLHFIYDHNQNINKKISENLILS